MNVASSPQVEIGLNAVIVAVADDEPRVLTVPVRSRVEPPGERSTERRDDSGPREALPFGPLDPGGHRTLELGLRAWVREQTGLELGYCEQLYTFGDRDRAVREDEHTRIVSVSYLALGRQDRYTTDWRPVYGYLPWEDWRQGRPRSLGDDIASRLTSWADAGQTSERRARRQRMEIAFGLEGAAWDPDRVLDRYELLYEAGLVFEAERDLAVGRRPSDPDSLPEAAPSGAFAGRPMPLDHRRILSTALGRLRAKIRYRPVVFELLPETFTLLQLQRVVESLSGVELHKQNFRRLVEKGGLVVGTGAFDAATGGRPAELFRFRREVLRERPALGVGLPGFARG